MGMMSEQDKAIRCCRWIEALIQRQIHGGCNKSLSQGVSDLYVALPSHWQSFVDVYAVDALARLVNDHLQMDSDFSVEIQNCC